MNSVASRRFWALFHGLPWDVQELAIKSYELWRRDPRHPSLHFRRLQGSADRFTVRIGDHYRALGTLTADTITWCGSGRMPNTTGSWVPERAPQSCLIPYSIQTT